MKVTITADHIERSRSLLTDAHKRISRCCPVTLAVLDALGRDAADNHLAEDTLDTDGVWSASSIICIDGHEYCIEAGQRQLINWFDTWALGRPLSVAMPSPPMPLPFEIEVPI